MRGQDDRAILSHQGQNHLSHGLHAGRIEAVHGFVEDEELGVPEQAGGHAESLAHSHGVLRHAVVGAMKKADSLERRFDALACCRFVCGGEDLEVLAPAQVAVEPGLVDDGADLRQCLIPTPGDGVSEKGHRAGIGMGQSQKHSNERGLAGSVGTEIPEGASPRHKELYFVDGDGVPETLGESVCLDRPSIARASAPNDGRSRRRYVEQIRIGVLRLCAPGRFR